MEQVAIFKSFTNNERFWDQYSQRLTVTQKQKIVILIHVKRVLQLSSFLYQNKCFILSDFSNYFYLFICKRLEESLKGPTCITLT